MFTKTSKKAVVKFHQKGEGMSMSSTSIPLNEGKLIEYLKEGLGLYGELVIRHISEDQEIHVTNSRTVEHTNTEHRIDEISDLIRDYVRNRAIPMESHAVFVDGVLKGVFGNESHAQLKRKNLIGRGFPQESIVVKPIHIGSFEDFE